MQTSLKKEILALAITVILFIGALYGIPSLYKTNEPGIAHVKTIDEAVKQVPFSVEIPEVMKQENALNISIVLGQQLIIENENIRYTAEAFQNHGIDTGGFYEGYELDQWYNFNDTIIRARGQDGKYYILSWIYGGTSYSLNYKPGLEYSKAFSYIGITESEVTLITADDGMRIRLEQYPNSLEDNLENNRDIQNVEDLRENASSSWDSGQTTETSEQLVWVTLKFELATIDLPQRVTEQVEVREFTEENSEGVIIICKGDTIEYLGTLESIDSISEDVQAPIEQDNTDSKLIHTYEDGSRLIFKHIKNNPYNEERAGWDAANAFIGNSQEISERIGVLITKN
jgi:hypothetical protein